MIRAVISKIRRRVGTTGAAAILLTGSLAPSLAMVPKAFATPEPAPINVRAMVGGNSIALLWNPASGSTPTSYKVYRGGVLKATVSPSTVNIAGTTQRWVDTAVTNGTAYSYQVSAMNAGGEESALSATVNVTQPSSPVPVPTITIATSVPSSSLPAVTEGKNWLLTWYPKLVTYYGASAWAPTSITLNTDATFGVGGYTNFSTHTITVGQAWADSYPTGDPTHVDDLYAHESTHLTQGFVNTAASWIAESLADYTKYYVYANNINSVPTGYTYLNGYERGAYLLNYAATTYNKPNFAKDLTVAAHTSGFDVNSFFTTQTGRTLGDMWYMATNQRVSSVWQLKNAVSGKCVDIPGSNTNPGTLLQIYTCNSTGAQQYTFQPDSGSANQGLVKTMANLCLDVVGGGTADGTKIQTSTCNGSSTSQKWSPTVYYGLKNVKSGKCLNVIGGGTANGTQLEIRTCDNATDQNWSTMVHMLGEMREVSGGCADVWGSGTTPGTKMDIYNCNTTAAQQWFWSQTTPGSTDGAIIGYGGQCVTVVGNGTATNTTVNMDTCTGAAGQKWVFQSDKTVKNPNSGLCLKTSGGAGNPTYIDTCNATDPYFQWTSPAM